MRLYKGTLDVMRPMPPFIRQLRDANRAGMKSQTRRVIDPQPILTTGFWKGLHWGNENHFRKGAVEHCKYGKAGSILYMREPLFNGPFDFAHYVDSKTVVFDIMTSEPIKWRWKVNKLSQLYMPKVAARSFFQYDFIRVERLQDISINDCWAEGITVDEALYLSRGKKPSHILNAYATLWNSINADRGFGWDTDPWVWVLGYKPFEMKEISVINSNLLIIDDPFQSREDVEKVISKILEDYDAKN